jgi:hypothetical protein
VGEGEGSRVGLDGARGAELVLVRARNAEWVRVWVSGANLRSKQATRHVCLPACGWHRPWF